MLSVLDEDAILYNFDNNVNCCIHRELHQLAVETTCSLEVALYLKHADDHIDLGA